MRVRLFSVNRQRTAKASERAADRAAERAGRAEERHVRNRFLPNAKDWEIETVPGPLRGEALD